MKTIISTVSIILLVGLLGVCLTYQFINPELTQTQLFLELWWTLPVSMLCAFVINRTIK